MKKALRLYDISKIYYYQPTADKGMIAKGKAFWLFSYFANGMNMKDIALLKFKNIAGDFITFERAKTLRSHRSNPKVITVYINDDLKSIITKWSNRGQEQRKLCFPDFKGRIDSYTTAGSN